MMKCLKNKKNIESSKFLTCLKSKGESFIQSLKWSAFYLLFIEGYMDLLQHIIQSSDSLNNEFEWIVLSILLIQIIIAVTLPGLGTFCLIKYQQDLPNESIELRHGSLYSDIRIEREGECKGEVLPLWNLSLFCAQRAILVCSCQMMQSAQFLAI